MQTVQTARKFTRSPKGGLLWGFQKTDPVGGVCKQTGGIC